MPTSFPEAARSDSIEKKVGGNGDSPESASVHSLDKDLQGDKHTPVQFTPEEAKRVLRKIDMWLMPILSLIYMLQYIDKSAMSYAAVYSFRKDNHLSSRDYSWLGTVFYLGYTFFEFPGAWLMQKMNTKNYMGAMIIIWGGLVMAMAGPHNFAGLAVVRTLLGAAESVVTPGFALLCARFYLRAEQPMRVGIWYCCNGLGSMLGGLLGYGVGHINNTKLHNWAWIFVINGLLTILAGALFLILCPDSPATARFLTPHERLIAVERVRPNDSALQTKTINWLQVREALNPFEDPQGWLLFLATFSLTVPNGGIGNFLHLILQEYGYDAFQTILIGLPSGAVQVVSVLLISYVARRFKNMRIYASIFAILWSLLGVAIQYNTDNSGARLFGYYVLVGFVPALGQLFSMPAANVNGYTKRITVGAMVFLAYGSGNALGPTFWKSGQNPPYKGGMLTCIICFCFAILFQVLLRLWYMRENRRKDRLQAETGQTHEASFEDITDVQNISFRYHL